MRETLFGLEYGQKTENHGKWEAHTCNMARKTEKREKKDTQTLFDLQYSEKQ